MGYSYVGDNSLWRLHYSEWRVLAEGMRVRNERQEAEMEKQRSGRSRPKGQPSQADKNLASDYAEEIRAAKQGKHPEQLAT